MPFQTDIIYAAHYACTYQRHVINGPNRPSQSGNQVKMKCKELNFTKLKVYHLHAFYTWINKQWSPYISEPNNSKFFFGNAFL